MKAWLVLQEGPGAGSSYSLDPFKKPVLAVGRSSACDVVLGDRRASRHHADIRWDGRQWTVVDRGSTNGTYVNGMQVHRPYELRIGDRVTIGETTMVLREYSAQPAASPPSRPARKRRPGLGPTVEAPILRGPAAPPPQPAPRAGASTGATVAFWLVQGVVAAAVVCLAAGAFLPWLRVTTALAEGLDPLIQSAAELLALFSGPESIFNAQQQIGGLAGYGKLTLAIAVISLIALVVDIFFYRKSAAPGIVYLVSGMLAVGAMGFDLVNYYKTYQQVQDLTLLFGIKLEEVMQVLGQFIQPRLELQSGLFLTVAGLLLLLMGGIGRLMVALLGRRRC